MDQIRNVLMRVDFGIQLRMEYRDRWVSWAFTTTGKQETSEGEDLENQKKRRPK